MPAGRGQCRVLRVEEEVDRVRWHYKVNGHHREVDEVLYRMHCEPTPWAGVVVFVVQRVDVRVDGLPVQRAMADVEVKLAPDRDEQQPPDRVEGRTPPVGV
eukprot:CAMPEP_0182949446 /NCGR_PEP_ID=MMETSP0105_2-20130417/60266_1 /TAXON_ID=81532 ORGANISM="Acanthoeca-like sp., Strain 10tr" /NCGR_SAMPLE_ID=MMETSP0105_2 /ASSEMBLY_ACC=CAM_ASM_000205 /LENGTH=100 /DNA_ID=CAMNT_0025089743 /DNA_START=285 /DNA_END=587 /DNA_ORIENTATION=+